MKTEFLERGSDDCSLLRIYEFDSVEARRLEQIFRSLGDGLEKRVELDWAEPVDGIKITLIQSEQHDLVTKTNPQQVEIVLRAEGWRDAAEFTEPFCDGSFGYQWIAPHAQGIQVLLSKDGSW